VPREMVKLKAALFTFIDVEGVEPTPVGSGTGAVVCRLLLAVSAVSSFVPV
jgi:hypothetical protein